MIDGKTLVCGLIGDPVEHTLSPVIHNTLAQETGGNLVYVPFPVKAERVEDAVRGARALSVGGLNVTVPHKSAVIPYLSSVEREAELIGAVNTLVPEGDGYRGYNTDLTGLGRALLSEGISLEGERVILLGAGGAARAAVFLCVLRGAKEVWLLNRTTEKAEALAGEANRAAGRECVKPLALSDWRRIPEGSYLAVQCTKAGLFPDTESAPIEEPDFYKRIHTGYDLVYRPARTKFMRLTEEAGGKAFNGLKMLLYQGIGAYELWTGVTVTEEQARICLDRMEKELYRNG